ncbi:hypothetical protein [Sinorhizobium psoraleae]|nr:hypothetical protein [Sinorhizobium psoraleae]
MSHDVSGDLAGQAVAEFLTERHGTKDFFILNTDYISGTRHGQRR